MENHEGPTPEESTVELKGNSFVGSSLILNTRISAGEIGKVQLPWLAALRVKLHYGLRLLI